MNNNIRCNRSPPSGVGGLLSPLSGVGGLLSPPWGGGGLLSPPSGVGGLLSPPSGGNSIYTNFLAIFSRKCISFVRWDTIILETNVLPSAILQ
jgi:hypothetical protein